jgi:hypothetical protein
MTKELTSSLLDFYGIADDLNPERIIITDQDIRSKKILEIASKISSARNRIYEIIGKEFKSLGIKLSLDSKSSENILSRTK